MAWIGSSFLSRGGTRMTRILAMRSTQRFIVASSVILTIGQALVAQDVRATRDIEYARVGDVSLKLDLYVPAKMDAPPLVLWVHGGAWRGGSKDKPSVLPLAERGFAVASVDYRLSPVAQFPAQIHDIKAAI